MLNASRVIRIFIQGSTAEVVSNATRLALSNLLSGFPGMTPNMDTRTAQPKPFLAFWPGLAPRSFTSQTVHLPHKSLVVSESIPLLTPSQVPKQPSYEPIEPIPLSEFGPTIRAPLGHLVYARSGDKGPNVNVGLFCSGDDTASKHSKWEWLRSFLTTKKLRHLLGEDNPESGKIERCEFPQIKAVHFIIHGVLGIGVGSTSKLDALGKVINVAICTFDIDGPFTQNVAEFIRARVVDIPSQFYDPYAKI